MDAPPRERLSSRMDPKRWRRCAALIAAYAVALQAVLSAFAVVVPLNAVAEASVAICRGDNPDAPAGPVSHASCGACLAGHCAGAACNPDRVAIGAPWPSTRQPAEIPLRIMALSPAAPRHGPHSPRAPPRG
jgi:hypothetical protein